MDQFLEYRKQAEAIFAHAIQAVQPEPLVQKHVKLKDNLLYIANQSINLDELQKVYVVGAGKATAPMALALENILQPYITDGLIVVKYDHSVPLQKIHTVEAAHPLPDENGIAGTTALIQLVQQANENDLVIVLLSGGGSALLVDLPSGVTLIEIQELFTLLLKSGADIQEINTVRKHLSGVKGGHLAKAISPAKCITLILSDVIGDSLDVIASGPTVPDPTTFADAIAIIKKYQLKEQTPQAIWQILAAGQQGKIPETPKPHDPVFNYTTNCIIGSNTIALQAAQAKATELGFNTRIMSSKVKGEARLVASEWVQQAKDIAANSNMRKPICLLMGGETTVTIQGNGLGGRNQEFALAAALELTNQPGIVVLAGGTDGSDGPTDAAGAVVDAQTLQEASLLGINPEEYLQKNDSYAFFQRVSGHIKTGPTYTNVMDIMIALITQ